MAAILLFHQIDSNAIYQMKAFLTTFNFGVTFVYGKRSSNGLIFAKTSILNIDSTPFLPPFCYCMRYDLLWYTKLKVLISPTILVIHFVIEKCHLGVQFDVSMSLSAILSAILNISKCPRVPLWHPTDLDSAYPN